MRTFFGRNASTMFSFSSILGGVLLYGLSLLLALTASAAVDVQTLRQQAVQNARQGKLDEALALLGPLFESNPDNKPLAYDYLVTLTWAGRDAEALAVFDRMSAEDAPAYVLEAAGKAARNVRRFDRAEALYREGVERFPGNIQLSIGLAYSLADQGDLAQALSRIEGLSSANPQNKEVLSALAQIHENRNEYLNALRVYDRLLDLEPGLKSAQKKRILVLDAAGASHLALDLAKKSPGLFTEKDMLGLEANAAAFDVRWGGMAAEKEAERFVGTDQALLELGRLITNLESMDPVPAKDLRRVRIDRLVALRNRLWMTEAIDQYTQLQREGATLPPYALSAAGDAYLYLECPERARDLYLQALQQQPGDFETEMSLFYAYIDLDDFPAAFAIIDRMNRDQAPWLKKPGVKTPVSNPQKLQTQSAACMARAYADMLEPAQRCIEALHEEAPYNLDLRQELASIYEYRGWPRKAREEYRLALAQPEETQRLGLQTGYARTQFDLNEYRAYERTTVGLAEQYPQERAVQRLQELWQVHNMRELIVEAGFGKSPNAGQSNRDLSLAATLFSRPLRYHYRFFTSAYLGQARFVEGTETLRRYGVGLEYRTRDLEAVAEATYNQDGSSDTGFRLESSWNPDDHWSVSTTLEKFSRDTPLRALKHGIDADSLSVRGRYRVDEMRSFGLGYQGLDFSDGNLRQAVFADWFQRLHTAPAYKLNGIFELYASKNSEEGSPYFNPRSDFSASATLENIWRQWRRYSCSFHHRLAATLGDYWQQDYGSGAIGSLLYEQRWNAHDRLEFLYGGSVGHRIYDGDSENFYALHLRLDWRF